MWKCSKCSWVSMQQVFLGFFAASVLECQCSGFLGVNSVSYLGCQCSLSVLGCEWCKCSCMSMQQAFSPHFLHRKSLNPSTPKCIATLLWDLSLKCWWLWDISAPCHISKFRNIKTLMSVNSIHVLNFLKILGTGLTDLGSPLFLSAVIMLKNYPVIF